MTLQMEVIVPQICKLGNGIQSSGDVRDPRSKRFALVRLRSDEIRQCPMASQLPPKYLQPSKAVRAYA